MSTIPGDNQWIQHLTDEDRAFIKRFVLASGSLKEMAKVYGVSYPTVRLRLDRLIQKIQVIDEHAAAGPFERQVRAMFAEGRIDLDAMRALLATHKAELSGQHAETGDSRVRESPSRGQESNTSASSELSNQGESS
jgi:hypothetical protein